MIGKTVVIELKNGMELRGVLFSVDQYLNIKLEDIEVLDHDKYPHMWAVTKAFIRGSVVRYMQLDPLDVDCQLLQDATRRAFRPEPQAL